MKRFKPKKRLLLILVPIFLLLLSGGIFAIVSQTKDNSIGKLQIFKGSAQVVSGSETITGFTGTPIHLKDEIKVANGGIAAVVLNDNSIVRLEGGSQAEIEEVTYRSDGEINDVQVKLDNGRLWSRVQPLKSDSHFEVETPTVTAAVRGTSFNTTSKDSITGIYVYHHTVQVTLTSTGGKQNVQQTQLLQMQQTSLKTDFAKGPDLPPAGFFDEWIKFNQAEDDRLCKLLHDIPGDCGESVPSLTKEEPKPAEPEPTPAAQPTYTPPQTNTPTTQTPPPATLSSIAITSCDYIPPSYTTTYSPPKYQCHATAYYSDGTTRDITTNQAVWSISNPQYGSIGPTTGLYVQSVCGNNGVIATFGGKTANRPITMGC